MMAMMIMMTMMMMMMIMMTTMTMIMMDERMHGKMCVATAAAHEKILMWRMSTRRWWIMTV